MLTERHSVRFLFDVPDENPSLSNSVQILRWPGRKLREISDIAYDSSVDFRKFRKISVIAYVRFQQNKKLSAL